MVKGVCKWFQNQKGFGFITRDDNGEDIFVHHTGITETGYRSLEQGEKVEFEVAESPKGPRAMNVRKLGK